MPASHSMRACPPRKTLLDVAFGRAHKHYRYLLYLTDTRTGTVLTLLCVVLRCLAFVLCVPVGMS